MAQLLEVQGVSVAYGGIKALRDVSLELDDGEVVAIIGANGAGKTTLLRALSGLVKVAAGRIAIDGRQVQSLRPAELAHAGVLHVPEGRMIFERFSVRENLALGEHLGAARGGTGLSRTDVFGVFPVLGRRLDQPAGSLSGGEQQMLAIARALLASPRIVMLDEPSIGLAPVMVKAIFAALDEVRHQVPLLIVEQNARIAFDIATRGYVVSSGRIVAGGAPNELSEEVLRVAYLGE